MALLIVVEVVLSVFFASGMMLYMGLHFLKSRSSLDCEADLYKDIKSNEDVDISQPIGEDISKLISKETVNKALKVISERKLVWLFLVMLLVSIGIWFYDIFYLEMPMLKSYINSLIFSLVLTMGYIDFKEHIIPNPLILVGMGIWGIGSILEIFIGGTPWRDVLTFSFAGFGICGGLLLILAIVLRSGLGMGDVKMYAMLGLLYGLSNTYSLLICTVLPMAVVALVLLASKKVTKKSTLPMAPFTVFAFLIGILGGM